MTDLAAGICLIVAAIGLTVRVLLLAPMNDGWPPAPSFLRVVMFVLACALFYRGLELAGVPDGGVVTPTGAAVSLALAVYSVTATFNVARQFYPPAVWRRMSRVMTLAECKNASVLIALSRAGVQVFFPNRKDPTPISESDIVDLPDRSR